MSDIFASSIATSAPLSLFSQKGGEVSLPSGVSNSSPVQTNNFYGNMLVGDQNCAVSTHPYSVWNSTSTYYGLALYHAQTSDRVFASGSPPEYYYSPTGIQEIVLSSSDFAAAPSFSLPKMSKFGATTRFTSKSVSGSYLECPLVQGMGFVTGIYHNLIPKLCSLVGFASVTGQTSPRSGVLKYKIVLNNSTTWFLYITVPLGQLLTLALKDSNNIISSNSVDGVVFQLCFATGVTTTAYDSAAGCYATDAAILATVNGTTCSYSLTYSTSGSSNSGTPLVFALPHHVSLLTSATKAKATAITLPTTTKGTATAYLTTMLAMSETLASISFAPYTTISGKSANYTTAAKKAIKAVATTEVAEDVVSASNVDSMYTSGKILAKYALVLYVCHAILEDSSLTSTLLSKMKTAIERFSGNTQTYPLFYDTSFKGIVSSATGSNDYGNGHYNDHHFHWGYHVHSAAITAWVDKDLGGTWYNDVKDWVNTLVRDVANPSTSDTHFPVSRSFDFYNGHSWEKGLYASADGKDEESSLEDCNFAYAMKLWGSVIGDSNMVNRGALILAIMRRSLNDYFLYSDSNTVQPLAIIPNKVSGILFENKIDHTTYFGTLEQYIQGIHMIPITPCSSYIRGPTFVEQEWTEKLSSIVGSVSDGWKGILMLNVALYDPTTAYNFFNSLSFSTSYLDNGMSKTWALAYCAGVGATS